MKLINNPKILADTASTQRSEAFNPSIGSHYATQTLESVKAICVISINHTEAPPYKTRYQEALKWLWSPCPFFKGRTPISLLLKAEIDPVLELLASIESGTFS